MSCTTTAIHTREAPKTTPERRKELAQEELESRLQAAKDFYEFFQFGYERKKFGLAAFNLNQTIENLLQMVQLVFICELPHTHNLQFPISAEQLERWSQEAELLFPLAEKVCRDRIKQGWPLAI